MKLTENDYNILNILYFKGDLMRKIVFVSIITLLSIIVFFYSFSELSYYESKISAEQNDIYFYNGIGRELNSLLNEKEYQIKANNYKTMSVLSFFCSTAGVVYLIITIKKQKPA